MAPETSAPAVAGDAVPGSFARGASPRHGILSPAVTLGVVAVIVAGLLPLVALLLASRSATNEVKQRTLAGASSTARAVAGQAGQAYTATVAILERGATSPTVLSAIDTGNRAALESLLARVLSAAPLRSVAVYDTSGAPLAVVDASGATGAPAPALDHPLPGLPVEGAVVHTASDSTRSVSVGISGGTTLGTLVGDVDLGRLLTDPASLRFGRTGVSLLVGTDGRILLAGRTGLVGTAVPVVLEGSVARSHTSDTLVVPTPSGANLVEAYVPIRGQPWGILTEQAESEAFAGVSSLSDRLQLLGALFAALGVGLAVAIVSVVARRNRRIEGQTNEAAATAEALGAALQREYEAVAELRDLDETRREFLASVSHDFRTPLAAMVGFAGILEEHWDRFDDEQRREFVNRIVRNGEELDRRVTSFLDFSALEQGAVELDRRSCPIRVALDAALERTRLIFEGRSVDLSAVDPGASVWADGQALERILENLLTNAAKYSPAGTTVTVRAVTEGNSVVVRVEDEGEGVAPDEAERIFERFYRASRGRGRPRGIGIGLSAVRQLLGLMDGRVWVEAMPERGSAFCFTLPRAPGPVDAGPAAGAAPEIQPAR